MIGTIVPQFGWTSRTFWQKYGPLAAFAVMAPVAGAATFAVAGLVGRLAGVDRGAHWAWAVLALVGLIYGAAHLTRTPIPVPSSTHQVPKLWREYFPPTIASGLYGFGLGIGFATKVPFATFYVAVAAALVAGDLAIAAAAGVAFGVGRTSTVVWGVLARRREDIGSTFEEILRRGPAVERANGVLLILAAAGFVLT